MAEFIYGRELSEKIAYVVKGENVRCAVAFWGDFQCVSYLKEARIVCDISMGGTSWASLKNLGAPDDDKKRVRDGLHAKVYLSDRGGVICSANASLRGIGGHHRDPMHVEAGIFVSAKSNSMADAARWFEEVYDDAKVITAEDLARAKRFYQDRPLPPVGAEKSIGFFERILHHPEDFDRAGFKVLICDEALSDREREDNFEKMKNQCDALGGDGAATKNDINEYDLYTGWGDEVLGLGRFFSFFLDKSTPSRMKLEVDARKVDTFVNDGGKYIFLAPNIDAKKLASLHFGLNLKLKREEKVIILSVIKKHLACLPLEGGKPSHGDILNMHEMSQLISSEMQLMKKQ